MFITPLKEGTPLKDSYFVEGTLLARPGTNVMSEFDVKVPVRSYSCEFAAYGNSQRGYWAESVIKGQQVWYKLVRPSFEYKKEADEMNEKMDKFLALYDVLSVCRKKEKLLIQCSLTIQELHRHTNEGFDLKFVEENGSFILMNIGNIIAPEKSASFLNSIVELCGLVKKKEIESNFTLTVGDLDEILRKTRFEPKQYDKRKKQDLIEKLIETSAAKRERSGEYNFFFIYIFQIF
jgi:hypothetical protein